MHITCCSICYMGHKWPAVLDKIAEDGWKNVELVAIPGWIHVDLNTVDPRMIAREIARRGLTLRAIHSGGQTGSNKEAAAAQLAYHRKAIEALVEAGADQLVFTGGAREHEPLDDLIAALQQLVNMVEGKPVRIGLENHYQNRIETAEDYDHIFSRIDHPQIGMTADWGHFNSSNVDTAALMRKYADRLVHVHVKDHLGTVSMPLGQGEVDIPELVGVLKEIGYDRAVSVELEVEDQENLDQYAAEALAYLTEITAAAGAI